MADKSLKTEQPTPHRIDKARREGQYAASRELLGALQFLAFVFLLSRGAPAWIEQTRQLTRALFKTAFRYETSAAELVRLCRSTLISSLLPLAAMAAVLLVLALAGQLAMTRMGFSTKRLAPNLSRLNPLSRLQDTLRQNLWALIKALVLLPLAAAAVWEIARENAPYYLLMPLQGIEQAAQTTGRSLLSVLWKAAGVFLALGVIDFARERRRYMQDLRMSRQELKDEHKELEGDPMIKARIRRLQRDLARRQMLREVKTATAVVVNPTHYAVALRYRMETMAAPRVVAKGRNHLALRIRQIAQENEIPLVENPPLAQALYRSVKVGQEIPAHLYQAVAEVLAYIYRLQRGRWPRAQAV